MDVCFAVERSRQHPRAIFAVAVGEPRIARLCLPSVYGHTANAAGGIRPLPYAASPVLTAQKGGSIVLRRWLGL